MNNIVRIIDYISWIVLLSSILVLAISGKLIENIINETSFLKTYSFYGVLIALSVLLLIYIFFPVYFNSDEEKRGSTVLSLFFGVTILYVFGAAYYNFKTAQTNKKSIKAFVIDKSKNIRYNNNYIKLSINNKIERFETNHKKWDSIQKNDTIMLILGKGKLKYNHVLDFYINTKDER